MEKYKGPKVKVTNKVTFKIYGDEFGGDRYVPHIISDEPLSGKDKECILDGLLHNASAHEWKHFVKGLEGWDDYCEITWNEFTNRITALCTLLLEAIEDPSKVDDMLKQEHYCYYTEPTVGIIPPVEHHLHVPSIPKLTALLKKIQENYK